MASGSGPSPAQWAQDQVTEFLKGFGPGSAFKVEAVADDDELLLRLTRATASDLADPRPARPATP